MSDVDALRNVLCTAREKVVSVLAESHDGGRQRKLIFGATSETVNPLIEDITFHPSRQLNNQLCSKDSLGRGGCLFPFRRTVTI